MSAPPPCMGACMAPCGCMDCCMGRYDVGAGGACEVGNGGIPAPESLYLHPACAHAPVPMSAPSPPTPAPAAGVPLCAPAHCCPCPCSCCCCLCVCGSNPVMGWKPGMSAGAAGAAAKGERERGPLPPPLLPPAPPLAPGLLWERGRGGCAAGDGSLDVFPTLVLSMLPKVMLFPWCLLTLIS